MKYLNDNEIVRVVMSNKEATEMEKELAMRVHRLSLACDTLEEAIVTSITGEEVCHGHTH